MSRMTPGNYYVDGDLIPFSSLEEDFPEQISGSWKELKFDQLEGLMYSDKDGYLESFPGRAEKFDIGRFYCNLEPDQYSHLWHEDFNPYPPLRLILVHNALITPADDRMLEGRRHHICEVRDAQDHLVQDSMCREKELTIEMNRIKRLRRQAKVIKGTYLYGGKFWHHYGHFAIETLQRLWPYLEYKLDPERIKLIFSSQIPIGFRGPLASLAMKRLKINTKSIGVAMGPLIAERLIIPGPSSRIHHHKDNYIHHVQKKTWDAVSRPGKKTPAKKIYLSRRLFRVHGKEVRPLLNEEAVEGLFTQHGFRIIHPDNHSFSDQLKIYGNASVMAGPIGSNMLNMAYANDGIGMIMLSPSSIPSNTFIMLSDVKQARHYHFLSSDSDVRFDSKEPWSVNIDDLKRFLDRSGALR